MASQNTLATLFPANGDDPKDRLKRRTPCTKPFFFSPIAILTMILTVGTSVNAQRSGAAGLSVVPGTWWT